MFVSGSGFEEVYLIGDLVSAVAKNTDGGGAGMVMMAEPLFNCITGLTKKKKYDEIIFKYIRSCYLSIFCNGNGICMRMTSKLYIMRI